jgi:anthranilate synthase component 1
MLRRRLPSIPDLAGLHRRAPRRYPFLLNSVSGAAGQSRYDILFAFPQGELAVFADETGASVLRASGTVAGAARPAQGGGGFLDALDRAWARARASAQAPCDDLPFCGGWFIYLSYELAGEIEPTLRLPAGKPQRIASATRVLAAIVVDRLAGVAEAIAEPGRADLIDAMLNDSQRAGAAGAATSPMAGDLVTDGLSEDDPEQFLAAVRRAREHIAAGDIFQANLSRLWRGELVAGVTPADLHARLSQTNPAPFAALVTFADLAVVSSSPERLVSARGGRVATRPIAGTRPRGLSADGDAALTGELIAHPKERAEHVMLIDLERNDLGRICKAGTVEVDEMMVIESYAHVHHIVSNISGELRDDVSPGMIVAAVFPGGTITGCPKVRSIEIISSLEGVERGPYTGSLGYLNHDGSMDLNILIRTLAVQNGQVSFRAGAGIVADSVPESELEETRAKAKGMVLSLMGARSS